MGERRVLEQIVHCEQHEVTQLLSHAIVVSFTQEKATQALLADVGFDGSRKAAFASEVSALVSRSEPNTWIAAGSGVAKLPRAAEMAKV